MIVAIPGFSRTAEACRKKFETVFKQYKEDKLANSVSGNDRHECKFYDSIDHWWHQAGSVMKHVSTTTMDNITVGGQENSANANDDVLQPVSTLQSEPSSASKKNKFQDQALHYFGKMVDNGVAMLDHFARTNELLQKVDQQMDRLIEKL
jgi:hypothetical protein